MTYNDARSEAARLARVAAAQQEARADRLAASRLQYAEPHVTAVLAALGRALEQDGETVVAYRGLDQACFRMGDEGVTELVGSAFDLAWVLRDLGLAVDIRHGEENWEEEPSFYIRVSLPQTGA